MFFFTPTLAPANGWAPSLSPNGRYLVHGKLSLYGVDLFPTGGGGVPVEVALSGAAGAGNAFSAGFPSDAGCYYADFTASEMRALATPGWSDTLIHAGAGFGGTFIGASGNHWGTLSFPTYYSDGVAWVPTVANPGGMGQAGEWIAYVDTLTNEVIVEKIDHSSYRRIANTATSNAWRLFAGPDGGYLFYAQGGQFWINNPANMDIVANLPGSSIEAGVGGFGGFGALSWRLGQLWVTTYAYVNADARVYALHRPCGSALTMVLPDIGANNFSMQVGQWPTGWTIAGATDGTLGVWADVSYDTPLVSFDRSHGQGATFPASGGGGGGSTNPGGSPGTAVLNADNPATPPPPPVRPHPHVDEIKDWPTSQSLKLAWDQLGGFREQVSTMSKELTAAKNLTAELIARLKKAGL